MRKLAIEFLIVTYLMTCFACQSDNTTYQFVLLEKDKTGLDFSNNLSYNNDMNVFNYMYTYNGGGIGAADFNNDGLIDLFFTSNQEDNKLYLNKGNLKFEDITKEATIIQDDGWSNGVSIVDINNDGLQDIYISQVGEFETLKSKNQLLVCQGIKDNGIPFYKEQASEYGLDLVGFSTQAAFLDYDMDGDLDMFQLNHSIHANGTFGRRKDFNGKYHRLSGDKLLKNENGRFIDVTKESGIHSTVIGYGLGISVGDINLDGYPDIYIGNDFHENDYLYINQKDGTFKDEVEEQLMHTSRFSMGVDIADINNDAHPEIISLDMLPYDPYILKKSEGEDAYDIFHFKLGHGYNHQYAKNNLQLNNGNNTFSELAMYSGIEATDWSWASLFADFDNDGLKDIFISNGIPKRMNDTDYLNFATDEDTQWLLKTKDEKTMSDLIKKLPEMKLPNKLFRNEGKMKFQDQKKQIANDKDSYSNGAIYADLDNDGDFDIVTNNINESVFLYENKTAQIDSNSFQLNVQLKGSKDNVNALGAKLIVFQESTISTAEKYPVRGFQSSMEIPLSISINDLDKIKSIIIVWPDNTYEEIKDWRKNNGKIKLVYKNGLPIFDYSLLNKKESPTYLAKDITEEKNINFIHKENKFIEFNREPLIPHMVSAEGPALAVGDINNDGLEDLFIGSSKRKRSALFFQNADGSFDEKTPQALVLDSLDEQTDAIFIDLNNDKQKDLLIATGGNEYRGKDNTRLPKLYLNKGNGDFEKKENAFTDIYMTASCILPFDFTGDGHLDLFIGGRAVVWKYGEIPQSYLLKNDGTGKFTDVTNEYSKELRNVGFVKHGLLYDIDQDKDLDILVSLEWDGIYAFVNENGQFKKQTITDKKGWWNFVQAEDFDNDGDVDLIAGNLGLNTRLKASQEQPLRMYYNDFDGNGKKEQILTFYIEGKEIPFANKMELEKQMPFIKKNFLYATEFAKASLSELIPKKEMQDAALFKAEYFQNAVLVNQGDFNFELKALPVEGQWSSYKDAVIIDANGDELLDVFIGGNFYENNIQMGRLDADYGSVLINKGNCDFEVKPLNGLSIKGQIRKIKKIEIAGKEAIAIARNNDAIKIISFQKDKEIQ